MTAYEYSSNLADALRDTAESAESTWRMVCLAVRQDELERAWDLVDELELAHQSALGLAVAVCEGVPDDDPVEETALEHLDDVHRCWSGALAHVRAADTPATDAAPAPRPRTHHHQATHEAAK